MQPEDCATRVTRSRPPPPSLGRQTDPAWQPCRTRASPSCPTRLQDLKALGVIRPTSAAFVDLETGWASVPALAAAALFSTSHFYAPRPPNATLIDCSTTRLERPACCTNRSLYSTRPGDRPCRDGRPCVSIRKASAAPVGAAEGQPSWACPSAYARGRAVSCRYTKRSWGLLVSETSPSSCILTLDCLFVQRSFLRLVPEDSFVLLCLSLFLVT